MHGLKNRIRYNSCIVYDWWNSLAHSKRKVKKCLSWLLIHNICVKTDVIFFLDNVYSKRVNELFDSVWCFMNVYKSVTGIDVIFVDDACNHYERVKCQNILLSYINWDVQECWLQNHTQTRKNKFGTYFFN
jgi:hypothetical protein